MNLRRYKILVITGRQNDASATRLAIMSETVRRSMLCKTVSHRTLLQRAVYGTLEALAVNDRGTALVVLLL